MWPDGTFFYSQHLSYTHPQIFTPTHMCMHTHSTNIMPTRQLFPSLMLKQTTKMYKQTTQKQTLKQHTCSVSHFRWKGIISLLIHTCKGFLTQINMCSSITLTHKNSWCWSVGTCPAAGLCPQLGCCVYEERVSKQWRSITTCQLFSVAMERAETQGPRIESCICPSDSLWPPTALIKDDRKRERASKDSRQQGRR